MNALRKLIMERTSILTSTLMDYSVCPLSEDVQTVTNNIVTDTMEESPDLLTDQLDENDSDLSLSSCSD
jgi:hypothetical protein